MERNGEKNKQELLAECLAYFQRGKGYQRIFERIRAKYESLGHLRGTVNLQNLTAEEKEALADFLKKDLSRYKNLSVKITQFQKCLEETCFSGVQLMELLEGYFHEKLHTNKETYQRYKMERSNFFRELTEKYQGTPGGEWLIVAAESRSYIYKTLIQRYDLQKEELRRDLEIVCEAVNQLPQPGKAGVYLPVFASLLTKNPHALDADTSCGSLFLAALAILFQCEKPRNAEQRAELYYQAGLLIDEVSNFVICSGLQAFTVEGEHPGWTGFYQAGEPLLVTLSNLRQIKRVISPQGQVFVLENPAVFAAILAYVQEQTQGQEQCYIPPLICTYGQLKIAALALLDLLAREGTLIYYAGDFNPEGMLIADRLSLRYGEKLRLWRYSIEDYAKAISCELLDGNRPKMLDALQNKELVALGEHMRQRRLAGYQELLLEELKGDILRLRKN
jgi:uncharacterized protein (TIGR02679 family)